MHIMKDKKILFIGGSQGMGLAAAKIAQVSGAKIIISGRNEAKLKNVVQQEFEKNADFYTCDAGNIQSLEAMFKNLAPIDDIVVTVAGDITLASSILKTPPEAAKQAYERFWINYNVVYGAKKYMNSNGSIILISGSSAKTPGEGWGFWGLLHGSINAIIKQAAVELAPIRVNAVSPGGIGIKPDRQLTEHRGTPEDVGQMIISLLSNPSVTGAVVDVDGGERQGHWNG